MLCASFPLSFCFVLTSPQTAAGAGRLLSGVGLLLCRNSWGTFAANAPASVPLGEREKNKSTIPWIPGRKPCFKGHHPQRIPAPCALAGLTTMPKAGMAQAARLFPLPVAECAFPADCPQGQADCSFL